jgi:hypothetical protein
VALVVGIGAGGAIERARMQSDIHALSAQYTDLKARFHVALKQIPATAADDCLTAPDWNAAGGCAMGKIPVQAWVDSVFVARWHTALSREGSTQ